MAARIPTCAELEAHLTEGHLNKNLRKCDVCVSFFTTKLSGCQIEAHPNSLRETLPDQSNCLQYAQFKGLVGQELREIQCWSVSDGTILKVAGGSEFYVHPGGAQITKTYDSALSLTTLDREMLLGPALSLAMTMQGKWCLHGSAIQMGNSAVVFLGDSGRGKSTLAQWLASEMRFPLVADDILPVAFRKDQILANPRFPQLKCPVNAQPWMYVPEELPLSAIVVLETVHEVDSPELRAASPEQAALSLLRHTAGTRLLNREWLAKHLAFSVKAASAIPFYILKYPHRWSALPQVGNLLNNASKEFVN